MQNVIACAWRFDPIPSDSIRCDLWRQIRSNTKTVELTIICAKRDCRTGNCERKSESERYWNENKVEVRPPICTRESHTWAQPHAPHINIIIIHIFVRVQLANIVCVCFVRHSLLARSLFISCPCCLYLDAFFFSFYLFPHFSANLNLLFALNQSISPLAMTHKQQTRISSFESWLFCRAIHKCDWFGRSQYANNTK